MNKLIIVLTCLLSFSATANDNQKVSEFGMGLLSVGKMTGACGIFELQFQFQENTKLDNGDEFFARFWISEAARLGMTLEEFANQCRTTLDKYEAISNALQSN